jgi:hypothetical protein
MAIRYQCTAEYQGRPLLAVFLTGGFVEADTYLLPRTSAGFSCNTCNGFHFNPGRSGYDMVQYNDAQSGNALTFAFALGTFRGLGTFTSAINVGSGFANLVIEEIAPGENSDADGTPAGAESAPGCC